MGFGAWIIVIVIIYVILGIRVIPEYKRAIVFRFGRLLKKPLGPGLFWIFPIVDQIRIVSLRTVVLDVPPQDIITRDNVSVNVNAVVYFRVVDPNKAVVEVENYIYATSQLAQTTLRSVLGEVELDELLSEREKLNVKLQELLDKQTDPWGIKVSMVEVKQVDLPEGMKRAMAYQAEAERERRAKIIHAQGEFQAAQKLMEASQIIAKNPIAIQLRYLQALTEISAEKNSTIVFPIPIEILKNFIENKK